MSRHSTAAFSRRSTTVLSVTAFVCTLASWRWLLGQSLPPLLNAVCIVGAVLLVHPVAWVGRILLDLEPTAPRAVRVTAVVHAVVMLLLGAGTIKAIQTADTWRGLSLPIPRGAAMVGVIVTGVLSALTVVNLALSGLGAPFAVALSRRLATGWLYSRTRNPMVLAFLAWLVTVGLWLQSALFLVWALIVPAPALLLYVRVFEERELDIRFGEAYRHYKARTSFLWPGKAAPPAPSRAGGAAA